MSTNANTQNPISAAGGEAAGQNGAHPARVTTDMLEMALAKMTAPAPVATEPAASAPADNPAGTETPTANVTDDPITAENQPAAANEAVTETDLSQPTETEASATEPALPPELAELPDDIRDQLIELAREVKEGKTNFGEVKRGHKLASELRELEARLEELQARPASPSAPANLHPEIAKLNSEGELAAKRAELRSLVKECRTYANGYTGRDGNEVTPEQVAAIRAEAENKLDDLNERAVQLQQQGQVRQQQAAIEQQVRKIAPEVFDQRTAAYKVFEQVRKDVGHLPNRDYAAAAFALGDQLLQARLKPAAKPAAPAAKPAAVIPKGKPAAGGGTGAPPKPDAAKARFEAVLPKPGQKVGERELEALLSAMPSR